MTTNIDYRNTNFEYSTLTKITGQPNYILLKKIKDELTANATSVSSNLGGGANGHLGLVLNDAEYATISGTPYVRPVHPGPLPALTGPQYARQEAREDHKEAIRRFRESENVDKALKKQLAEAIPAFYLKRFRNPTTNTFTVSLSTILHYLFTTYGEITPDELREKEKKVTRNGFRYNTTINTIIQ